MVIILTMCVGRLGCHFSGLEDGTYGTATTLPWGTNFGDGVARHPTNLYEISWLLVLGAASTPPPTTAAPTTAASARTTSSTVASPSLR